MKKIVFFSLICIGFLYGRYYEVPPTHSGYGSTGVISDKAMEDCVKLYNKTKWLGEEINSMYVDRYDSNSVNEYNQKVRKYKSMIATFNAECAGKQSQSAYETAQRLNQQQGVK